MASEFVRELTDDNWQSEVLSSKEPVLVDFWAPWCAPCRAIAPQIEALAEAYQGKIKVGKINLDENNDVPRQYQIRSIPTLMIFKDGEVIDQMVGAVGRDMIEEMIEKAV